MLLLSSTFIRTNEFQCTEKGASYKPLNQIKCVTDLLITKWPVLISTRFARHLLRANKPLVFYYSCLTSWQVKVIIKPIHLVMAQIWSKQTDRIALHFKGLILVYRQMEDRRKVLREHCRHYHIIT